MNCIIVIHASNKCSSNSRDNNNSNSNSNNDEICLQEGMSGISLSCVRYFSVLLTSCGEYCAFMSRFDAALTSLRVAIFLQKCVAANISTTHRNNDGGVTYLYSQSDMLMDKSLSMHMLGKILRYLNTRDSLIESKCILLQALDIRERLLAPETPWALALVADTLHELGILQLREGQQSLPDAETSLKRSLQLRQQTNTVSCGHLVDLSQYRKSSLHKHYVHVSQAATLHNLASVHTGHTLSFISFTHSVMI